MSNVLKSQGKIGIGQLIENQLPGVRSPRPAPARRQATPLRGPASIGAGATPGGASARQSLSPSLRPHTALSGRIGGSQ